MRMSGTETVPSEYPSLRQRTAGAKVLTIVTVDIKCLILKGAIVRIDPLLPAVLVCNHHSRRKEQLLFVNIITRLFKSRE